MLFTRKASRGKQIRIYLITMSFLLSSCTSVRYGTDYQYVGETSLTYPASTQSVRFFQSAAPRGFSLDGEMIMVDPAYRHEVLGEISVTKDGISPGTGSLLALSFLTLGFYSVYYVSSLPKPDPDVVRQLMIDRAQSVGADAIVYANITTSGQESSFALGRGFAVRLDVEVRQDDVLDVHLSNADIRFTYLAGELFPAKAPDEVRRIILKPTREYAEIATLTHSASVDREDELFADLKEATAELGGDGYIIKKRTEYTRTLVCGNTGPPANAAISCKIPFLRLSVMAIRY